MQLRFRLFQERPDTISLDCCEEFFEGFLVSCEWLFPDSQAFILIDDLQRPAARASNGTKNIDQDRHPVVGELPAKSECSCSGSSSIISLPLGRSVGKASKTYLQRQEVSSF
jgi:hypothetical protein